MQILVFLLGVAVSVISPFKRSSRRRKPKPNSSHRRFYNQGFMVDEIDALESIFDTEDAHRRQHRK